MLVLFLFEQLRVSFTGAFKDQALAVWSKSKPFILCGLLEGFRLFIRYPDSYGYSFSHEPSIYGEYLSVKKNAFLVTFYLTVVTICNIIVTTETLKRSKKHEKGRKKS